MEQSQRLLEAIINFNVELPKKPTMSFKNCESYQNASESGEDGNMMS